MIPNENWLPQIYQEVRKNPRLTEAEKKRRMDFLLGLLEITVPGRYLGGEWNLPEHDWHNAQARIGLSYPDLYDIGTANIGINILYQAVNHWPHLSAERIYAPWPDMAEYLKKKKFPLYTLETMTPIHELDLIGFNLSHELLISNILYILDLGQIPLTLDSRNETHPLIMLGGSAASNPAPYSAFAELFFLGDGDEAIVEITESLAQAKSQGQSRMERIHALSKIEGVMISPHIPGNHPKARKRFFRPEYSPHAQRSQASPGRLEIVPLMKTNQSRLVVEVARGCGRGCRFCQAGFIKRPYKNFKYYNAKDMVEEARRHGWDEISFNALSITDYPYLRPLLTEVLAEAKPDGISVGLPSLRIDATTMDLIEMTGQGKRSTLTFALESGSPLQRQIIRKDLDENELYRMSDYFLRRGWDHIKLYLMLGLPFYEEIDEVEEILRVLEKLDVITRRISNRKQINVTLSPFVPKPHTPFQWLGMAPLSYFRQCVSELKRQVPRRILIKEHNPGSSILEAALARGSKALCPVILSAYEKGAQLDGWSERFALSVWEEAFAKHGMELTAVASHSYSFDSKLPWDDVEATHPGFLRSDWLKSRAILNAARDTLSQISGDRPLNSDGSVDFASGDRLLASTLNTNAQSRPKKQYLIALSKTSTMRYISHLEFSEFARRLFRRARLPFLMSQGFNVKERISLPPALPLGVASKAEPFIIELTDDLDLVAARQKLEEETMYGVKIGAIYPTDKKSLFFGSATYRIAPLDPENPIWLVMIHTENQENFLQNGEVRLEKRSGNMRRGVRNRKSGNRKHIFKKIQDAVLSWEIASDEMELRLLMDDSRSLGIVPLIRQYLQFLQPEKIDNEDTGRASQAWYHFLQIERIRLDEYDFSDSNHPLLY